MSLLAEQLRAPMSAEGAKLRKYLADTVLPVVSQIKEAHAILEDKGIRNLMSAYAHILTLFTFVRKVDMGFSNGILQFNEACKKMELMAIQDEDEIKSAYIDSQVRFVIYSSYLSFTTQRLEKHETSGR